MELTLGTALTALLVAFLIGLVVWGISAFFKRQAPQNDGFKGFVVSLIVMVVLFVIQNVDSL